MPRVICAIWMPLTQVQLLPFAFVVAAFSSRVACAITGTATATTWSDTGTTSSGLVDPVIAIGAGGQSTGAVPALHGARGQQTGVRVCQGHTQKAAKTPEPVRNLVLLIDLCQKLFLMCAIIDSAFSKSILSQ